MKRKTALLLIIVFVIAGFFIYRSITMDKDLTLYGKKELKVQLQWFDGAQFCGLYVAKEKGFFDEENLVVDLIPINTYSSDPIAILMSGATDIAIATADQVLINKDNGKEIKAIGTVFNRSLACYMYKTGRIKSINDLKDKKIGVYKKFDTENILLTLIRNQGWPIKNSDILQAGPIDAFRNDNIDVLGSYLMNEPVGMRLEGIDVEVLDPVKYGVEFYSDTYITKYETWANDKESLTKFLKAANKGWEYAKLHPEESIDIMFNMLHNMTKDLRGKKELESLKVAVKYLGDGPSHYYSFMDSVKWGKMEKNLFEIGRIKSTGYIPDLCDFNMVNNIYETK